MTQVLFSQRLIFANDSYLWKNFKKRGSRPLVVTKQVGGDKLCDESEAEALGETGFIFCQADKDHFKLLK